jgi:hypothetical protein
MSVSCAVVLTTPLGNPVVPLVYIKALMEVGERFLRLSAVGGLVGYGKDEKNSGVK